MRKLDMTDFLRGIGNWAAQNPTSLGGRESLEYCQDALNTLIGERVAAAKAEWVKRLRVVRCECMETGLAKLACVFGGPQLPDSNCTLCAGSGYVIEERRA